MTAAGEDRLAPLFAPFRINDLPLANRIVMAPMTRRLSPGGVPGGDVAAYYRRRAEGGVGLIVTEGTWIPHWAASADENVPRFHGADALAGWKHVVDEVHAAGGRIAPQLWHVGQTYLERHEALFTTPGESGRRLVGPSGMVASMGKAPRPLGRPASDSDIADIVEAYATAARSAYDLGFDAVELHGAHGYVLDQFNWRITNLREDGWGGGTRERTRFACEVVRAIRAGTNPRFPVIMRMSQWKIGDYGARLADTPAELAEVLEPMTDAGVDVFHCSQRRFWEGEFGSDLNLAGWAKRLTGRPSIAVGSVGLDVDFIDTLNGQGNGTAGIERLLDRMARGDFDLIAIGRALLMDAEWPRKVRDGAVEQFMPYDVEALASLD